MKPADQATIEAFLDDQLTVDELSALRDRIAVDAGFAEALAEAVTMHGGVQAALDADWDGIEMQTRVELALGPDDRACPFTAEVMDRLVPVAAPKKSRREHWRKVMLAAAPVWLAALLVLAFLIGSTSNGPTVIAEVEQFSVGTTLTRQGTTRPLIQEDQIMAGDELAVNGEGRLVVRLGDGSRLELSDAARMRVNGDDGEALYLDAGTVRAEVEARGPDRAMTVTTHCATAIVVGTIFEMSSSAERSELRVSEGVVDFVGGADEVLRISAGERALARPGRSPVRIDPAIFAAANEPLAPAIRDFREDEIAVLIRFGPESMGAGGGASPAEPETWVEHLRDAGVGRVLLEVWTDAGVRLWPEVSAPTAEETAWIARHDNLPKRLAEACAAAGIRYGIACPMNQPQALAWLRQYLASGPAPCEVHCTDVSGDQLGQLWDWRAAVKKLAPKTVVTVGGQDELPLIAGFGRPFGRYLRLGLAASKSLPLQAEVEVMANGKNVASAGAARPTDDDDQAWWEVDLGRSHLIDDLTVRSRLDAHRDKSQSYQIQIRDERQRVIWQTVWDASGQRSKSLHFDALDSCQPQRRHLALRKSRYYQRADETELVGGREIFGRAVENLHGGIAPLLVVTPDANGLLPGHEVESLMHYRARWRLAFERPLPLGDDLTVSSGSADCEFLGDGRRGNAWEAAEWTPDATIEYALARPQAANAILLREPLDRGSRQPVATVFYHDAEGWHKLEELMLSGDRLLAFPEAAVDRVRIHLNRALYAPALEEAALLQLPN